MPKRQTPGVTARLVARLAMAGGRVVPDDALMLACWGDDEPEAGRAALVVMVCLLRKRLPVGAIDRVRDVGYRLAPAVAAALPAVDERIFVPAEPAVKRG